ncbi:hypothetical protein [Nocardia sp. NPDC057440]|uniref:hypothetical protein n=1 Tax=Nocardia sp. NPDC057440 TaxID=3346134 RepID=UPI00366A964F
MELMSGLSPDRVLLAAAKVVLDYRSFMDPAITQYWIDTGHDHPLAAALAELSRAVKQVEGEHA